MNDAHAEAKPQRYSLTFLTEQWEWDVGVMADTLIQAKTAARTALEALVHEEAPELACVYILDQGIRIGVWDWVERRPYWTPL